MLTDVADQLRPSDPRRMGPYRLTGRLGGGGMGEVFLGKSAGGRLVAVKVIRPELAADREFRVRFKREVAAARRVNGLYTAMVADADTDGPVPWLATAYVPGPSLEAAVARHGALPVRSVLALAAGLAEGLGAVHAAGLVHRDVKPSNVLLSADGPMLIDFGIAWDAQSTVLTEAGTIVGSPQYMSPEYAIGQQFGPPTDVFSLGAVLVYAATGRPPFHGSTLATIVGRIVHEPVDLSAVPPQARPVIGWCLAKDPAARPTPAELVARLGDARLIDAWLPEQVLADIPGDRVPVDPPRHRKEQDTQTMRTAPRLADPPAAVPPTDVPAADVPPTDVPAADVLPTAVADASPAVASAFPPIRPDEGQPDAHGRHRAPAVRARARLVIPAAAALVVVGVGAGLWFTLGQHGSTPSPSLSPTATPTSTGSAAAATSPYRFAVAGVIERPCATVGHSVGGSRPASVAFADQTASEVRVFWVDYQGRRKLEFSLKPGGSGKISAYVGNDWQLAGPSGCIGAFTTTGATARITVDRA